MFWRSPAGSKADPKVHRRLRPLIRSFHASKRVQSSGLEVASTQQLSIEYDCVDPLGVPNVVERVGVEQH